MLMDLKRSQHTLMIRKNLRNAHIMNKSYIVNRKLTHRHHSAGSPLRGSAFALSIRTYDRRACCT